MNKENIIDSKGKVPGCILSKTICDYIVKNSDPYIEIKDIITTPHIKKVDIFKNE